MEQYISKSALLAEIERILLIHTKRYEELAKHEVWTTAKEIEHRIQGLKEALSIINSLEVKGVDLEKEINTYISNNFFGSETLGFFANRTKGEPDDQDIALCAKHFFELGFMYTLSWKDIRLIAEIGEEFVSSEESDAYTNEESYYNAILNKLKEKGLDYKTQRQEIRDIKALKGEEA